MIYLVRHGDTDLNEANKIRGWTNAPLNVDGMAAARLAGLELLKHMPVGTAPALIICSDLARAAQTGAIIGQEYFPEVYFYASHFLRPWNLGNYTGQPAADIDPKIKLAVQNPSMKIPGGESFNDYTNRFVPYITPLIESPQTFAVVAHLRNVLVTEALCDTKGKSINPKRFSQRTPIEPGCILKVSHNWEMTPIVIPMQHEGHNDPHGS